MNNIHFLMERINKGVGRIRPFFCPQQNRDFSIGMKSYEGPDHSLLVNFVSTRKKYFGTCGPPQGC